jgi:hypothetical protein
METPNVKLKAKDGKKDAKPVEFSIGQANKLLKLPNTQWELDDKAYKWNGTEIAKL